MLRLWGEACIAIEVIVIGEDGYLLAFKNKSGKHVVDQV
jgi:hypothetical protein